MDPEPKDDLETWFLHRVAKSVEAGVVSGDLLTELRTEMELARELPQEGGHGLAITTECVLGTPAVDVAPSKH